MRRRKRWGEKTEEEAKNREGKESESSEKGKAIRDLQKLCGLC